jgi:hypothetical protein
MNETIEITEREILSHAIEGLDAGIVRQIADGVLQMRFPQRDQGRVSELLEKNSAGTITPTEYSELEKYIRAGDFITMLKARVRRQLSEQSAA